MKHCNNLAGALGEQMEAPMLNSRTNPENPPLIKE